MRQKYAIGKNFCVFVRFFIQIVCQFKKLLYLCTRFRE